MTYILAPEAVQDLHDLWDYIAVENVDAADRVIDTLFTAFERLATMPGLGHRCVEQAFPADSPCWPAFA